MPETQRRQAAAYGCAYALLGLLPEFYRQVITNHGAEKLLRNTSGGLPAGLVLFQHLSLV